MKRRGSRRQKVSAIGCVIAAAVALSGCMQQIRPEQVGLEASTTQAAVTATTSPTNTTSVATQTTPTKSAKPTPVWTEKSYPLGTGLRQGRWSLGLEAVTDPAPKAIRSAIVSPKERPVSIRAKLTNAGKGPGNFYSKTCLALRDSTGKQYQVSTYSNGPVLDAKGLPSNAERVGDISFRVDKDATGLTLILGCDITHPWVAGSLDPVAANRAGQEKGALTPKDMYRNNSAGEYYEPSLSKPLGTTVQFGKGWEATVHHAYHAFQPIGALGARDDGTHALVVDIEVTNKGADKKTFSTNGCLTSRDDQGREWEPRYPRDWGKSLPRTFKPGQRSRGVVVLRSPNAEAAKHILRLGCSSEENPAYVTLPTLDEGYRHKDPAAKDK